jgi:hypothetical protein
MIEKSREFTYSIKTGNRNTPSTENSRISIDLRTARSKRQVRGHRNTVIRRVVDGIGPIGFVW